MAPSDPRLESDDIRVVLRAIGEIRTDLDRRERQAVAQARTAGLSWQEIAELLVKATSSVFERYRES